MHVTNKMEKIYFEEKGNAVLLDIKIGYFESIGIAEAMPESGIFKLFIAGICDSYFQKGFDGSWTIKDGNLLIPQAVDAIGNSLDRTFN